MCYIFEHNILYILYITIMITRRLIRRYQMYSDRRSVPCRSRLDCSCVLTVGFNILRFHTGCRNYYFTVNGFHFDGIVFLVSPMLEGTFFNALFLRMNCFFIGKFCKMNFH